MRRILVEPARRKRPAQARRRARSACDLDDDLAVAGRRRDDDLLALDEALDRLAADDPRAAELVELRYFAGLTVAEAAAALGISPRDGRPALGVRPGLAASDCPDRRRRPRAKHARISRAGAGRPIVAL